MTRRNLITFCLLCLFFTQVFAATAIIKVPVAEMYKQPNLDAGPISQAIYGASVDVVKRVNNWTLIGTHDDYTGWVANRNLVFRAWPKTAHTIKATNLFVAIYQENDMNLHPPIMVPYGTTLPLIKVLDEKWVKVMLPSGQAGFMRHNDVAVDPKPMTMRQMLRFSRSLVGLTYVWSGVSTYGFDCSGFVQFLYKQIGVILPRDAGLMAKWPGFIKVSRQNLRPGDVMLMGYNNQISHAGVYLGNGYFVNSTSYLSSTVKISKLSNAHWTNIFITARRLKKKT